MSIRFPNRFTIRQPPPPLAGVVIAAVGIGSEVVVVTTGAGFMDSEDPAAGSSGASLCFSTIGSSCGGGNGVGGGGNGVTLGFGGNVAECLGVDVDVGFGCTGAAF